MKLFVTLMMALLFLQFVGADEGTALAIPPMGVEEYRTHIAECRALEDSLRGPNGSFTEAELKNPTGDMSLDEKNREMWDGMIKCLQLVISYSDDFYRDGKITKEEYDEAQGVSSIDPQQGLNIGDYSFGRIAGETFSAAFYSNCKALVKYYLDSARAEKNPEKKDALYDKAIEVYFKCMQTASSDLVDYTIFQAGLGLIGENDDEMNLDVSIAFRELCEGKINRLKEKLAVENNPDKKIGLYRQMQDEIIRCTQFAMSELVDSSSDFADWADALSGGFDGNGLAQEYAQTFRAICETRLSEAKKKIDAAANDGEREKAREEYAKIFVECLQELDASIVPWELRKDPFDYINPDGEELDAVQKACAQKIEELENERKKPKNQRSEKYSGYNDYGLDSMIRDLRHDCGQTTEPVPVDDVFIPAGLQDIARLDLSLGRSAD